MPRIVPLATLLAAVASSAPPAEILVPKRNETAQIFAGYVEHVDALQHIIHVPSVRIRLESVYDALEIGRSDSISGGQLALLLAVLGHTAGLFGLGSHKGLMFSSPQEALAVSTYWVRCALDATEYVWRVEGPGLEVLQAKTIMIFSVFHVDGVSSMSRSLMATILSDARDLGVHTTDSPRCSVVRGAPSQADIINVEMGRRVWWHLVSTDWSAALSGGPQEGVYSVIPRHMQVNKPRNVIDDDLSTMPAEFSRPLDEPTSTTYYLQRIALAEVCREVVDILLDIRAVQDPQQISYTRIVTLDGKFAEILNRPLASGMLTRESGSSSYDPTRPHIRQQYFTYLTTEARRCKLHLPYLLRLQQGT